MIFYLYIEKNNDRSDRKHKHCQNENFQILLKNLIQDQKNSIQTQMNFQKDCESLHLLQFRKSQN